MAAALRLLMNGPMLIYVVGFAIVTVLLEVFVRYSRYASVLRWLSLSLFAYVATVFAVGRHAESILEELGRAAIPLRHPSMGGAVLFRRGLQRALMAK